MRFLSSPRALGLVGVLILLISFTGGFFLFFPVESLRPRLEAAAAKNGLRLTINSLKTSFPVGVTAQGVTVSGRDPASVGVKMERITVLPVWSSLLFGKAEFAYEAVLLGGRIKGTMQRRGPLTIHGEGLTWRGPLPGLSGTTLVTHLRQGEATFFWPIQADDEISIVLDCDQTTIEGLLGAKNPVLLGNVTLNARGKGKDLRLTSTAISGGQLTADGSGTILLNEPFGRSLLNLNLTLRSQPGLDPTLVELLTAFVPPAADGTSRLRLTGTLSSPQKGR